MPTRTPPQPPNTWDLILRRGTSLILEVTVAGLGSIAAAQITSKVKKKIEDPDEDAVIVKTIGDGITITQPGDASTSSVFQVKYDPADTQELDFGSYEYDVLMQLGDEIFPVIERSHFDVQPTVTRSMS